MIKKLLLIFCNIYLISNLFADWIVPPSSLPQNAISFIQRVYPNVQIWKVEIDDGKYEVKLSNGTEIDFLHNGDWVSIDGEYNGVPLTVLPEYVANTVRRIYPQAIMIEVEKKWDNYKIKLNNMMKLYISYDGQLMGQKWDD